MKKYLLILVAMVATLSVCGQSYNIEKVTVVTHKFYNGDVYAKITNNKGEHYRKMEKIYQITPSNLLEEFSITHPVKITADDYEKCSGEESVSRFYNDKLIAQDLYDQILNQNNDDVDESTIIAVKYSGKDISTSAGLLAGLKYELLQVQDAEDKSLIGCPIVCQVLESRKSNINGSEGRLSIRPLYIKTNDGGKIKLVHDDIFRRGLNRANVKFWTSFTIVMIFCPGSRAEITDDDVFVLTIDK